MKPGTKLLGLNDKFRATLRNGLSEAKFLVIDKHSTVSSNLWIDFDSRLGEMFMMIPEKVFPSLSVMTVAELLQLPLVRGKFLLSQFSGKDSDQKVVMQNDKLFIDLLNKARVGNIDDDVEKLLKARFIHEYGENYPKDAWHMIAENQPAMKRNEAVLSDLPGELYTIEANDKIPDNCKYPLALIQAAQNQKQTNAGGLAKLFKLKC